MRSQILTLLTDFGLRDVYVGVMKGVIASIDPTVSIIDLSHEIPPQDMLAGRFSLLNAYKYFPLKTVHIAVIDPGVGSKRRGVAIEIPEGYLVGADNGLFSGILSQTEVIAAVELNNPQYWRVEQPSLTFHGRDIFAPVGAYLASGVAIEALGDRISVDSLVSLSLPEVIVDRYSIVGCIQYIDVFGNLISNIAASYLRHLQPQIIFQERSLFLDKTYSDRKEGELIAIIGSHGYLEIAVNCGNAQQKLQAKVGDTVSVNLN